MDSYRERQQYNKSYHQIKNATTHHVKKVFSVEEVEQFLQTVEDGNSIHAVEDGIVPAFLLLDFLEKELGVDSNNVILTCKRPLYIGKECEVYTSIEKDRTVFFICNGIVCTKIMLKRELSVV